MAEFNLNVGGFIGAILATIAAGVILFVYEVDFDGYSPQFGVFSILAGAVVGTLIWRKIFQRNDVN